MGRIWIALALALCLLALGCPKPLPTGGRPAELGRANTAGTNSTQAGTDASAAPVNQDAAAGDVGSGFVGPLPPSTPPANSGETPAAPVATYPVGPELPPDYTTPAAPADASPVQNAQAAVRDAMDPDAVQDDLINGPPGSGAQQRGFGDASLAGSWQVFCATTGGEPRWYDPGMWSIRLEQDGSAVITRQDSGQAWEQRGAWQAEAGSLSLHLGPGGEHTYTVAGEDPDVKTLAEANSKIAFFILRLQPGTPVPQLYQSYQTDFGPLTFSASGPGRWEGNYGQPAGKLTVRMRGPFCTGIWEQAPNHGGVIMRLSHTGFTGWWWYDGSLGFDGRWNGNKGS